MASAPELPGAQPEVRAETYFPAPDAANFAGLVSAAWVRAVQEFHQPNSRSERPPTYRDEHLVVLEASWGSLEKAEDYRRGHVPGAIHLDTDEFESGYPTWKLRTPDELQRVIGRHGITPRTTVVVYGKQRIAAARVWWVLKYAGVADARLLDGGYEAWTAMGYSGETTVRTPIEVEFSAPENAGFLATTEHVRTALAESSAWLADTRSRAEFEGRRSGYKYLDARGRIPGAIWVGDADDAVGLYGFRDGRLRVPAEIDTLWRSKGLVATQRPRAFDREVIFYCGGGWRSSLAFFYAWLLGYENIRNYSDGWAGWSTEYVADASAKGTPGWRQERTANPIEVSSEGRRYGSDTTIRALAAAAVLVALLLWESIAPFHGFFRNAAGERVKHGFRNLTLGAVNATTSALLCVGLWTVASDWADARSFGLLRWLRPPGWAHWIGVFLVLDLWMYLWHRVNHRVPFLWRFHRTHHSDSNMDVTTASRFHLGEVAISCVLKTPVIVLAGVQLPELAAYEAILFAMVQWHHANIALPGIADRVMRLVVVTPFMHKVHHSDRPSETNSNYSSLFSFWDRLFGTFRWRDDVSAVRMGLEELRDEKHQTLVGLLATPARRLADRVQDSDLRTTNTSRPLP